MKKMDLDLNNIYYPVGDDYASCLRRLYSINGSLNRDGIVMPNDLDGTRRLYQLLGSPLDRIPTIHVGGTNGKGTTSFKIAQCLKAAGLKTGLFVSPHISSFRERVQVNNELISEEDVVEMLPKICKLCVEHGIPATLFEVTFALACLKFDTSQCEVAVIEVGLGGKFDATNVISTTCSVLCSVSLDHTRILGSTVEAIARVKAGIFKSSKPALIGMGTPIDVLKEEASKVGARLNVVNDVLKENIDSFAKYPFLKVYHEKITTLSSSPSSSSLNISSDELVEPDVLCEDLALAALTLLPDENSIFSCLSDEKLASAIVSAASQRPPCRWELLNVPVIRGDGSESSVTVVLDVGHNPAAVSALSKRIKRDFQGRVIRILYGVSRDKDIRACLRQIITCTNHDRIHFAHSDNFRAATIQELCEIYKEESGNEIGEVLGTDLKGTIAEALKRCADESDDSVLIVCGTGYIMPQVRNIVGIQEPRDYTDLQR